MTGMQRATRHQFRWWPYPTTLTLIAATALYGVTRYDSLPPRYPTHTGFNGRPDEWGAKSVLTVFGPLLVAGLLTVVMWALARWTARVATNSTKRSQSSAVSPQTGRSAEVSEWVLASVTLCTGVLLCVLSVLTWHSVHGWGLTAVLLIFLTLMVAVVIRGVRETLRASQEPDAVSPRAKSSAPQTDAIPLSDPMQDRTHWVAGLLYNNPDDPRTLVPKRLGVGVTVNAATRAGRAMVYGLVVLTVVTVVILLGNLVMTVG